MPADDRAPPPSVKMFVGKSRHDDPATEVDGCVLTDIATNGPVSGNKKETILDGRCVARPMPDMATPSGVPKPQGARGRLVVRDP